MASSASSEAVRSSSSASGLLNQAASPAHEASSNGTVGGGAHGNKHVAPTQFLHVDVLAGFLSDVAALLFDRAGSNDDLGTMLLSDENSLILRRFAHGSLILFYRPFPLWFKSPSFPYQINGYASP